MPRIEIMGSRSDQNYVSVGSWMMLMFLTGIPFVGWLLIIVLALVGRNESRKNYFRALIAWILIIASLALILFAVGLWPEIHRRIQAWVHRL